jgi:AraC-like DNA-binding protein
VRARRSAEARSTPDAAEALSLSVVGLVAREPVVVRLARPSLVLTLEASVAVVTVRGHPIVLDRTGCLVAQRQAVLTLDSTTSSSRVVVLGFGERLVQAMVRRYAKLGVEQGLLDRWLSATELLPRTVWVHEIVHRYVFEREALGESDNLATRFLEIEMLKEIYFLFRDRCAGSERETVGQRYTLPVERAVAWIEAHLFEPCGMRELARRSGASESTLLRSFRRELGCRPGEYWRSRRLDESLVLLRAGRYTVAEVALRAGYQNPTSFGHAFRVRFGHPPSDYRPSRPTRRAP